LDIYGRSGSSEEETQKKKPKTLRLFFYIILSRGVKTEASGQWRKEWQSKLGLQGP
jgi:hypothetical protein